MAGVISTDWNAILNYWLVLLGIGLIMGVVTALIGWASKGGNNSAE